MTGRVEYCFRSAIPPSPTAIKIQNTMSFLDPSMEDLPIEVMDDILSRLPVKTIIHCKFVCKKWLDLVSDSYFAKFHLSRSPAGIMIHHISKKEMAEGPFTPGILKLVEVEDELDHHHLHHDPSMSLDLNLAPLFQKSKTFMTGSVDGLICMFQYYPGAESDNIYICNPITREYMILPNQKYYKEENYLTVNYGFGVGLVTKEYKVIRTILRDMSSSRLEAEVNGYVLVMSLTGLTNSMGHFLNGHAHWPASGSSSGSGSGTGSDERICVFDFDEETFNSLTSPPKDIEEAESVSKLWDEGGYSKLTLWLMKEYGIKKYWCKELVIGRSINPNLGPFSEAVYVIEGSKNGTILMASYPNTLLVYYPRRKTIVDTDLFDRYLWGLTYRPSFHRLNNIENERLHVF
ncbi:hypothetical protein LXL04_017637 [Taraxacum kok-saghyz]